MKIENSNFLPPTYLNKERVKEYLREEKKDSSFSKLNLELLNNFTDAMMCLEMMYGVAKENTKVQDFYKDFTDHIMTNKNKEMKEMFKEKCLNIVSA